MAFLGSFRQLWWAPIVVGVVGVILSTLAYRIADRADEFHVIHQLESRADWRARDIEAKVRLSGNAVENVAIAMAVNPALGAAAFGRLASLARRGVPSVHALEWAPRVPRDGITAFEQKARADGFAGYSVFDASPDFHREPLADRSEYFPVLYETRFGGKARALGLALGRFDGGRIPMEAARDTGGPAATAPVRPIGTPSSRLLYLLFWPVYDGIDVPPDVAARQAKLRGYAVGNYDIGDLLAAALRNTPTVLSTIRFSIAPGRTPGTAVQAAAVYSPVSKTILTGAKAAAQPDSPAARPAARIQRDFDVFGQHWFLTFDYSPSVVAGLRSDGAWGWLVAGLLLTASLVVYLIRARRRMQMIERLVRERTASR